jgi:nicotinate-nucleotide adenylyltransferase
MTNERRFGIMGGTFDPPHIAHLVAAEEARVAFSLDRVIFIPAGQPPHKEDCPTSDVEHRYAMVLLATAENPHFDVSRLEIERGGPSYSVDTIRELRDRLGPRAVIYFIAGADEILSIESWHEADALPELARFIAVPRPGFDLSLLENALPPRFIASIDVLSMREINISATEIRRRVSNSESIIDLVPRSVEAYIRENGLYILEEGA